MGSHQMPLILRKLTRLELGVNLPPSKVIMSRVNKYRGVEMPRTVKEIEQAVEQLTQDQLAEFRAWYEKFDAAAWDRQIEEDIVAGKLDALADAAIADHKAGRTKKL
jgi:hypothetical protein